MKNLLENQKSVFIPIGKGSVALLEFTRFSIDDAINFYLCRTPFTAINQTQAGNIYFLKKLKLAIKFSLEGSKGNLFIELAKNEPQLLDSYNHTINSILLDIQNHFDKYGKLGDINQTSVSRLKSLLQYIPSPYSPAILENLKNAPRKVFSD